MPTLEQARAWYTGADPIHAFDHVERVYHMAERLAIAEGADLEIVRAAALLHDAEGTTPGHESRATHHQASAEFAMEILTAESWPMERIAAVQHCIRAHRFRTGETPETIEAKILFDADKLDVLGAVGAARVIGYAALAGQPAYFEPSDSFVNTGKPEAGEPHSAYHEYIFKLRRIKERLHTSLARQIAAQRDEYLNDFFQRMAGEIKGKQ
jgi:uncharacterized protein